jgi:hypothetical protein
MKKLIGIVAMLALVTSFATPSINSFTSSPAMEEVLPSKVSQLIAKLPPEQREVCARYYAGNMPLGHVTEEMAVAQLNNLLKMDSKRRDPVLTLMSFGPPESISMLERFPGPSNTIYEYFLPRLLDSGVAIVSILCSFVGPLSSIMAPTMPAIMGGLDAILNLGLRGIVPGMEVDFSPQKFNLFLRDCRGKSGLATSGFKLLESQPHLPFLISYTPEEVVAIAPLLKESNLITYAAGPILSANTCYSNTHIWSWGGGTAGENFVGDLARYLLMEMPKHTGNPPLKKIGVVAVNYPLIQEVVGILESDFWKRVEEMYDIEVAGIEICSMNPTSTTPQLVKLKKKGIDTLLLCGFGPTGVVMVNDLYRTKMTPQDGYSVIGIPFDGTVGEVVGQDKLEGIYLAFDDSHAPDELDYPYVEKSVKFHRTYWGGEGSYAVMSGGAGAWESILGMLITVVDRVARGDMGMLNEDMDRLLGEAIRKHHLEERVEMMREKYGREGLKIEEREFTYKELTELAKKMSLAELEQSFMPSDIFVKEILLEAFMSPNLVNLAEQVIWEDVNHNYMGDNLFYGAYPQIYLPGKVTIQSCLSWQWRGGKLLDVKYRSGKPWEWVPPGIIPGPGPCPPHGWAPPPLDGTPIEYGHPWGTWTIDKFLAEYDVPLWWFILQYAFDSRNQLNKDLFCKALNTYFDKKKVVYDWGDPYREVWQWGEEAYREVNWSSPSERIRILEEFKEMYYLPSQLTGWVDEYIAFCAEPLAPKAEGLICAPCLPLPGQTNPEVYDER